MSGPYGTPSAATPPAADPLAGLDPAARAAIEAQIAQARAAGEVTAVGGDLSQPLEITHGPPQTPAAPAPAAAPAEPRRETADEYTDRMLAEQQSAEVEDFGAFWAEQGGGKRLAGIGVPPRDLQLPLGMPLRFEVESERLKDSEDIASVRYLFDILFGAGTWDDLVARGLNSEQLPVLFMWASSNLSGRDMTLAQAKAESARMLAEKAAGKAPAAPAGATTVGGTSAAAGR